MNDLGLSDLMLEGKEGKLLLAILLKQMLKQIVKQNPSKTVTMTMTVPITVLRIQYRKGDARGKPIRMKKRKVQRPVLRTLT